MSLQLGDFAEDAIIDFKWSSQGADGASITRGTNGTISVYIGNGTTQLTDGVTDSEDFDAVTGVHHCRIDLGASSSYVPGSECQVVLAGAAIDGKTVNAVLAHFSIERAGGALAVAKAAKAILDKLNAMVELIGSPGSYAFTQVALSQTAAAPTVGEIADGVWDEQVDGTTTARQSMRGQNSVLMGKVSGLDGAAGVFRDLADTKDRVSATVDEFGNRTAVVRDLT